MSAMDTPTLQQLRALLYVLGYPRQPFPGGNFIEGLYVKTHTLYAELKLTLHDY